MEEADDFEEDEIPMPRSRQQPMRAVRGFPSSDESESSGQSQSPELMARHQSASGSAR